MYFPNAQGTKSVIGRAISAEIRARLATYRISGKQLATDVGVSQNYLAKRLRDEASFTVDDVSRIVYVLPTDESAAKFIATAVDRHADDIWDAMHLEERNMSEPDPRILEPDEFDLVASRHDIEDAPEST